MIYVHQYVRIYVHHKYTSLILLDKIFLCFKSIRTSIGPKVLCKNGREDLIAIRCLRFLPISIINLYVGFSNVLFSQQTSTGGRITVFQTCLPSFGPGRLGRRELTNMSGNSKVCMLSLQYCVVYIFFRVPDVRRNRSMIDNKQERRLALYYFHLIYFHFKQQLQINLTANGVPDYFTNLFEL